MPEIADWIQEEYSDVDISVGLEQIQEWYEENLEETGGAEKPARVMTKGVVGNEVGTGGDAEVKLVTLGMNDDPFRNGRVFIGYALAIPPEEPAGLASIIFDEEDLDFRGDVEHHFMDMFRTVKGDFKLSSSSVSGSYVMRAVPGTELTEFEGEKSEDELRDMVDDYVELTEVMSVGENMTMMNNDGFPEDYGVDMRRIEGTVAGLRCLDEQAMYQIQDDSFGMPDELGHEITDGEDVNGLVCWCPEDIAQYAEQSYVTMYGFTKKDTRTDQITFQVTGMVGESYTKELDKTRFGNGSNRSGNDEDVRRGNSGGSPSDGAAEERTI